MAPSKFHSFNGTRGPQHSTEVCERNPKVKGTTGPQPYHGVVKDCPVLWQGLGPLCHGCQGAMVFPQSNMVSW